MSYLNDSASLEWIRIMRKYSDSDYEIIEDKKATKRARKRLKESRAKL